MLSVTPYRLISCIVTGLLPLILALLSVQVSMGQNSTPGGETNGELYESRRFNVSGEPSLRVLNFSGDILVMHEPEADDITVSLYIDRGFSLLPRSRNLDNYRIIMSQRGNEIVASVEGRRNDSGFGSANVHFSYVIKTPREISVDLRTISGQIVVTGIRGRHFLRSASGSITVRNSDGFLTLQSSSGSAWIINSSGVVHAQTEFGSMELRNLRGETRVSTVSGNILVDSHSGFLASRSVDGNIQVSMTGPAEGITLQSVSGDVDLTIPDGGYEIEAEGINLQLSINGGFSGFVSGSSAAGTIGDGNIPVVVKSTNGQVSIRRR